MVFLSWGILAGVGLRKRLTRAEGIGLIGLYVFFIAVSFLLGVSMELADALSNE
ncbi:MAG: hypothetical protein HC911_03995 [Chloroflexaceae bacterium]|nr:hypothetical protein [Chloroflexaceae bacterium]